jgi:hypothetical protein
MTNVFNFTLYLRKETRKGLKGVAYYSDEEATIEKCWNVWPSCPDRRNTSVFYNCSRYRVVWLADLLEPIEVVKLWTVKDGWPHSITCSEAIKVEESGGMLFASLRGACREAAVAASIFKKAVKCVDEYDAHAFIETGEYVHVGTRALYSVDCIYYA